MKTCTADEADEKSSTDVALKELALPHSMRGRVYTSVGSPSVRTYVCPSHLVAVDLLLWA